MTRPIDAALIYARRAWPVFPCHTPLDGGGCSCRQPDCHSIGKHPRVQRGLHDATTDLAQIRAWWRRWPDANIGLVTGARSNLVVLDVDYMPGGATSLRHLTKQAGQKLPDGLAVITGTGAHFYFAHPGTTIANSAGRLGPGLDIRGDGGYVIAPPSRHSTGLEYRWHSKHANLPGLPTWIADRLVHVEPERPKLTVVQGIARSGETSAWAKAALEGEAHAVAIAPEGTRNNRLNIAAYRLGQIAGGGHLDEELARSMLEAVAQRAGLSERESLRTIDSGIRAGLREPRHPSRPSARIVGPDLPSPA